MLISYNWLQNYFDEKLPEPQKLAEILTFSAFEIEGITPLSPPSKRGEGEGSAGDTVLDVKVLPDRACYALSHRGVAYEVSAITGLKQKEMRWPQPEISEVRPLEVKVEAPQFCNRYTARVIEGVKQKEQPWVKGHLEAIGQRSINPIVDGANIVMFDMGQPLHAFDADKVKGGITVRMARGDEKITTLDNKEINLNDSILVIADDEGPLALAGIKGGKKAEVTNETKNIILESANFDASYIRKTSEKLGIKTDSSKRFENNLTPEFAGRGMADFSTYLYEMDKGIKVGEIFDSRPADSETKSGKCKVEMAFLEVKLGVFISPKEVEDIFARLELKFEKEGNGWIVSPPVFRRDLIIAEDIAEEVARLYGYEKVPESLPPSAKAKENNRFFAAKMLAKKVLTNQGFSEIYGYTFKPEGDLEIAKPLSADKAFLRTELFGGLKEALSKNLEHVLLDAEPVALFELGDVFTVEGEKTFLAVGIKYKKKKFNKSQEVIAHALGNVFQTVGIYEKWNDFVTSKTHETMTKIEEDETGMLVEMDFGKLFELSDKNWPIEIPDFKISEGGYKPISAYPRIVRDVALFVPSDCTAEEVSAVIKDNATNLLSEGPVIFDQFEKNGKKSLAFRFAFQAFDRTLSDDEVNKVVEKIHLSLQKRGWEVR
ncbi:MAG: phenylalanine--tRNA ligase subunit beta [bacterium]|nr:phenylalanine--tRNA ligase subunit beta [bacterium]